MLLYKEQLYVCGRGLGTSLSVALEGEYIRLTLIWDGTILCM